LDFQALALRPLALDGTRIHPQHYHLAAQIVINALEVESQHVSEERTLALNSLAAYVATNDLRLVRDVDRMVVGMRRRHRLGELDLLELETFARQIQV
jgi:transcriptional accessory protein Tex/SPT6